MYAVILPNISFDSYTWMLAFFSEHPNLLADNNALPFISDDGGENYNLCHCTSFFLYDDGRMILTRSSLVQFWDCGSWLLPLRRVQRVFQLSRIDWRILLRALGRCARAQHCGSADVAPLTASFLQWDRVLSPTSPTLSFIAWASTNFKEVFM